ncbi:hypothetical protein ILP97_46350 [Amycolatopsis sp. H6(2020)]|nr:hypothetical protein [Amycolatopsis sp. H6(2020)]
MTATEHALSELLRHAARRVRGDGHFELQAVVAGAPARAVDIGPIVDLLSPAAANIALYERRLGRERDPRPGVRDGPVRRRAGLRNRRAGASTGTIFS